MTSTTSFPVDRSLFDQGLSSHEILLLSYLRQQSEGEWITCSTEDLAEALCMASFRQAYFLRKLIDLGLVETKRQGVRSKRWLRVTDKGMGHGQRQRSTPQKRTRDKPTT